MAMTSFFDKADSGASVVLLVFIFGGLPAMFLTVQLLIATHEQKLNTWVYVIFAFVLPPTAMVQMANLLLYSDSVYKHGITFASLFDSSVTELGVNAGGLMVAIFVSGIVYLYLGYYLNKVVKHRYGKREECCYCIKNNHIIPIESMEEEDPAISVLLNELSNLQDSIEPVDPDVASRDGVFIHKICKSFPPSKKGESPIVAVDNFSAALQLFECSFIPSYEGQITALLGHNGAGKSTLLSVLTGLYNTTSGDATIYGHSLNNELSLIRKDLGVCFQQNLLISVLTVRQDDLVDNQCREHLTLFARLRKVPEDQIPAMVEEALVDVGNNACF